MEYRYNLVHETVLNIFQTIINGVISFGKETMKGINLNKFRKRGSLACVYRTFRKRARETPSALALGSSLNIVSFGFCGYAIWTAYFAFMSL